MSDGGRTYWVGGATGFLGQALVHRLRAAGHRVVGISRSGGKVGDVEVQALDVCDPERVTASARGCDGAFYALGKVSRDPEDAGALHKANLETTQTALPALREAGVPRVVYASTSGTIAVGTDPQRRYSEDDPTPHAIISRWPYYRTKLYAERFALEQNGDDFQVVVVNPSLLLGPGDSRGSSNQDVRRLLSGSLPALPAGGLALVDVRDAAEAMILAFEKGRAGQRYLISAANLSCSEFFGRLGRLAEVDVPKLVLPRRREAALAGHWLYKQTVGLLGIRPAVDSASVDMGSHFWYCDTSRAERELGFEPRDPQETLRETVEDLMAG